MREDLADIKRRFKESTIKAAGERAKARIEEEGLKQPAPNVDHFTYLTGYSADDLAKRVDSVIEGMPDEFFEQTYDTDQLKVANLVAAELLSSHHKSISNIAKLFKAPTIDARISKPIEALAKKDNSELRAQFRAESIALLNDKARQCIDTATLDKLPASTNYFQYITAYKERLINKRIDQLIDTLPDGVFNMNPEYQTQARELLVNEIFYSQVDLEDDEKFLGLLFEFFDKLLSVFKEIAIAEQEGPALKDPKNLRARDLKTEFGSIKDFSDKSPELKVFAANCTRYIAYLQKEGGLLELDDLSKGDFGKRLEYLKEYLGAIQFLVSKDVSKNTSPILEKIKESIQVTHNKAKIPQIVKELRAKRDALETAIKQANEAEEIALIASLNGPDGNKLESNGLTKRQAFGLKLFKEFYKDKRVLTGVQKEFVQNFLVNSLGNMKLNRLLDEKDPTEKDLKDLTYRTKDLNTFSKAAEKLIIIHNKFKSGEPVSDEDKLNLREYGVLKNYIYMLPFMERLNKGINLLQSNKLLNDIYNKVQQCAPILKGIDKLIEEEASQGIQSGDLLLNRIDLSHEFSNKETTLRDYFTLMMTEHYHTTKLVRKGGEAKTASISHIATKGASTIDFDIKSYLYSDVYKINIIPLININVSNKLNDKYGPDYQKHINAMYREIETEIHANTGEKFKEVALRDDIEYKCAWLSEFIGPLGHSKLVPESLDKIREDIMAGAVEKNRMLCSEFAARTTVAAFVALNNRLKDELGIKEDVITIPFKENERFRTMHPDRLLKILGDAGCIEKLERTETEKKYLKFADRVEDSRATSEQKGRE